jgi:hypothetical protein
MKFIFVLLLVLLGFSDLFAQELSLSTSATYGRYSQSQQRDKIISESLHIAYTPSLNDGLGLSLNHSSLSRIALSDIAGNTANLSYYHFFTNSRGNHIGGKATLHHISSDDPNSDGTTIPHLSISYKPASLLSAFEIGLTHTPYTDATAQQVSAMVAMALFDQEVWSQTRVTYITLSIPIQKKNNTVAVEERLSYYVVPNEITLSFYALFGERIYAYDVDLGTAYNLPDIQKGSLGVSLNYNLEDEMRLFVDITQEQYYNADIGDGYLTRYFTVGGAIQF